MELGTFLGSKGPLHIVALGIFLSQSLDIQKSSELLCLKGPLYGSARNFSKFQEPLYIEEQIFPSPNLSI